MRDYSSSVAVYVGTLPVRLFIWAAALELFYRDSLQRRTKMLAVLAGTGWSYALDGVMVILYRLVPGMEMFFC